MSAPKILREVPEQGRAIARGVLDLRFVSRLKAEFIEACKFVRDMQIKNGVGEGTAWFANHLLTLWKSFVEFLESEDLRQIISALLDGRFGLRSASGTYNVRINSAHIVTGTETFLCAE